MTGDERTAPVERPASADAWDPAQYERFRAEREQPFHDLLALVEPRVGMAVLDLGCGTGELTALLHHRLRAARTTGVDRSAAMLAKGAAPELPGLTLREQDIDDVPADGTWDLVFSNAALHWLPDHPALFARLSALLAPGGQLAVQVPANHEHPAHVLAAELAGESPFREELGGFVRNSPVLAPAAYSALLDELGFERPRVRLEVYPHRLGSTADVVEWVRGTLLTAYQERLSAPSYARFLEAYRARLLERLGDRRPFFYPFARILMHARR